MLHRFGSEVSCWDRVCDPFCPPRRIEQRAGRYFVLCVWRINSTRPKSGTGSVEEFLVLICRILLFCRNRFSSYRSLWVRLQSWFLCARRVHVPYMLAYIHTVHKILMFCSFLPPLSWAWYGVYFCDLSVSDSAGRDIKGACSSFIWNGMVFLCREGYIFIIYLRWHGLSLSRGVRVHYSLQWHGISCSRQGWCVLSWLSLRRHRSCYVFYYFALSASFVSWYPAVS